MIAEMSDFHKPAKGASVAPGAPWESARGEPNPPAADEAALMNILRLINRLKRDGPVTPVEHAFVLGAKAMFQELTQVCDDLLAPQSSRSSSETSTSAATPAKAANEPKPPAETGRSRSRRPTPGGATPPS